MAWDLTVMLENRPGALADLGDAVGRAGVNLAGGCAVATGPEAAVHILVEDGRDAARDAIADAGLEVSDEREVIVASVQDEPGTLGSYARRLADAGVNIELFYVAAGTRLVFGVDDLERARVALA